MLDPMLDTRRYSVTSTAPDGRIVTTHEHTWKGAKRMALLLRAYRGHRAFAIRPEVNTPIPNGLLVPCAQPATAERRG